jgi:hypothetical protein
MDRESKEQFGTPSAALSLICVLLILFAGFAQANHVHTDTSGSANHECSVCSVAHAGALINVAYRPVPVFVRSILVLRQEASPKSLLFASFLYIRPPPSA